MKKTDKKAEQDARPVYVLCPRCEINYIDKKEKYCAVCKAELGMGDPSILLPDEDDEQSDRICPICHVNPLAEDEDVCFECRKDLEDKENPEPSEDDDNPADWEPFAEDEEEEIPDGMQEIFIDDEEEEEEEEEEPVESVSDEPDDFDFDVDPNDFEEDDEEDDDWDEKK